MYLIGYGALGPLEPPTAIATLIDLRHWKRRGPVRYRWDDGSDVDLNLLHNQDTVFFPEPVLRRMGRSPSMCCFLDHSDVGADIPGDSTCGDSVGGVSAD